MLAYVVSCSGETGVDNGTTSNGSCETSGCVCVSACEVFSLASAPKFPPTEAIAATEKIIVTATLTKIGGYVRIFLLFIFFGCGRCVKLTLRLFRYAL